MKHIQPFELFNEQQNINEEISFSLISPKHKLRKLFDSFETNGKNIDSLVASISLSKVKELFSKTCDILHTKEKHKNIDNLIQNSNVFTVDSMVNCLKRIKKDLNENREIIGTITYDNKENKFYYISYYN